MRISNLSDSESAESQAVRVMADVARMASRRRKLIVSRTLCTAQTLADCLVGNLPEVTIYVPFEGKTIVVSHHCPVPEVAGDKHEGN